MGASAEAENRALFYYSYTQEPHATRRKQILEKHPEVKEYFGIDHSFKFVVFGMSCFQIIMAYLLRDSSWSLIGLQAYIVGGTISHSLTLAVHELAHNLGFGHKKILQNRLLGFIANLPMCIPMSISFKKYHLEHHRNLGEDAMDTGELSARPLNAYFGESHNSSMVVRHLRPGHLRSAQNKFKDIPTEFEARYFVGPIGKCLWLFFQPIIYAVRNFSVYKKSVLDFEILNAVLQFAFNMCIIHFMGWRSFGYLLGGFLMGVGLHPLTAHFISDHYVVAKDQETYSYYGAMNLIAFNVGYHVEHHDFPYVPGRNLPKIAETAPEFYKDLSIHKSWIKLLFEFIFNPKLSLRCRMKRHFSTPSMVQFYGVGAYASSHIYNFVTMFLMSPLANRMQSFSMKSQKCK